MADIKKKEANTTPIKVLDRAGVISNRMKGAYIKTKEQAEAEESNDRTPSVYATDRIVYAEKTVAKKTLQKGNAAGKRAATKQAQNVIKQERNVTKQYSLKQRSYYAGRNHAIKKVNQVGTKGAALRGRVKRIASATGRSVLRIIAGTKALITALLAGGWIAVVIVVICCLFGAALFFFGGEDSYTPVSAEVESYGSTITMYAKEYGISDYTELIKAVMMQESKGKGEDPMGVGADSPEESIKVGVKKLAGLLKKHSCDSPVDIASIMTVLRGYNDEEGYANKVLVYYPYGNYAYGIIDTGPGKLGLPIEGLTQKNVTSRFGYRESPGGIGSTNHKGIDIGFPIGTHIHACESGKVTLARVNGGYGKCIIIDHGNGLQTLYAHLNKINVYQGQNVVRGQYIGDVGNTGVSTGPHLHLELRVNGKQVNPEKYVSMPK